MSQQGRLQTTILWEYYYLIVCRPVLLSGNVQSSHVGTVEMDQKRYNRKLNTLSLCRPELLSGYVQSEYVAAVERVQATIL